MKATTVLITIVLAVFVFSGNTFAQEALSIKTDKIENFFSDREDVMVAEFTLIGLSPVASTKEITENVLILPGVVKFAIKNMPDNNDNRGCVIVVKKENYQGIFSQAMRTLNVKTVSAGEKNMSLDKFVESYK